MKYVLMFVETEQFTRDMAAMSDAERQRAYERVNEWFADNADKLRGGSKLKAAETATTVRLDRGEPVVIDGPFVEGKEVVSGYVEIEVGDLDEALQAAKTWPGCPVVEIRPIDFEPM
ncbi:MULTISPECIES: YciI family protein [unclassified Mycolicibacterium]|uniref:YciI family protein n=1 Tax=unclassified Mycolicibacterium TaxID=2636767 RepID=UPI002EDA0707